MLATEKPSTKPEAGRKRASPECGFGYRSKARQTLRVDLSNATCEVQSFYPISTPLDIARPIRLPRRFLLWSKWLPAGGERDFRGERRTNDQRVSSTDPDVCRYRKGPGREARLYFMSRDLMENRNG